jgi:hypothetical protein
MRAGQEDGAVIRTRHAVLFEGELPCPNPTPRRTRPPMRARAADPQHRGRHAVARDSSRWLPRVLLECAQLRLTHNVRDELLRIRPEVGKFFSTLRLDPVLTGRVVEDPGL